MISRLLFLLFILLCSHVHAKDAALKTGIWRGILQLNDSTQLPFNFEVKKDKGTYSMEVINADERIPVQEIKVQGDSLFIRMPVFDSGFRCRIMKDSLKGNWINEARASRNIIPFRAYHGIAYRFEPVKFNMPGVKASPLNFSGRWDVTFSPGTKDAYKAVGEFVQEGQSIKGTFLTETGDYRFLEGDANIFGFRLSCFDGSHAFLFKSFLFRDTVRGSFWSGAHHYERWIAVRNDKAALRSADSLTYLKPGYDKVDFTFPNLEGKNVSLSDEKYKGKVLAELHKKYNNKGLEVIALAFERAKDPAKAAANVKRLKQQYNAGYEFLLTGKTGKDAAAQSLPMLNHVMAFPTTIFIDKSGKVRKIHTGFSGPGTGKHYTKFVEETTQLIEALLKE
jgi:thiol-disulfide isomerase/thioredoxin